MCAQQHHGCAGCTSTRHSSSIAVVYFCRDDQQVTEGQRTTTQQLAAPGACVQHVVKPLYNTESCAPCKQGSLQRAQHVCVWLAGQSGVGAMCAWEAIFCNILFLVPLLQHGVLLRGSPSRKVPRQCQGLCDIVHATPWLDAVVLSALVVHVVVCVGPALVGPSACG